MTAVAAYARGDGKEPSVLRDAFRSEKWGLPFEGGWMEQPAGMLDMMTTVLNVYHVIRSFDRIPAGRMAEWVKQNPDAWQLLCDLDRLVDG